MSIVLPIVFFAVGMGLFAKKMTPRLWTLLIAWIALVIAYNYLKPPAKLAPAASGGSQATGGSQPATGASGAPTDSSGNGGQ